MDWSSKSIKCVRLSADKVWVASQYLIELQQFIPLEFNRKPWSLTELTFWKATEFRTFVIYVSPVNLKDIIKRSVYENCLLLHVTVSILIS